MADTWAEEEQYWRIHYSTRPYVQGRTYDTLGGAYRYGFEAANRYPGRSWYDIERDLERDWESYEYRGQNTWQQVKDAVRDAWERVTGHEERAI